jgi:AraC family transcriptional regulator of adaptative response/methylated-DNA-[protein]-cysteine methyltransferase
MVQRACRYLGSQDEETTTLAALSGLVGISAFHLQRTFKSVMGITPRQYADACRTKRFKSSVRKGESVTNAMYDAGYGSSSRLYERANSELGMTPATYQRGGSEMLIDYTIAKSSLGFLLVAATGRGICAVKLGDSEAALEAGLRNEYAAARIQKNGQSFVRELNQILDYLADKQPHLDLPLDIRATAFQRQVWEALRAIPYGSTRSYSDVAKQIGRPTAVRAVARACATNPVALVIPCHRVIREDGNPGGYRWGLERKKALLKKESLASRRARSKVR